MRINDNTDSWGEIMPLKMKDQKIHYNIVQYIHMVYHNRNIEGEYYEKA